MTGTAALLRRWLCRLEWSECRRLEPAHFKREQLRRTRGWRKPTNTIVVSRPSRWGNPYPVRCHGRSQALQLYVTYLRQRPDLLSAIREELAGHNLACWCREDALSHPFTWRDPRLVFVDSMSDLFHAAVPIDFLGRVFEVMERTPQHWPSSGDRARIRSSRRDPAASVGWRASCLGRRMSGWA